MPKLHVNFVPFGLRALTMALTQEYLQHYLDEFVFRFNRRKTPMAAFQTLLGISASKQPLLYKYLIQGSSKP